MAGKVHGQGSIPTEGEGIVELPVRDHEPHERSPKPSAEAWHSPFLYASAAVLLIAVVTGLQGPSRQVPELSATDPVTSPAPAGPTASPRSAPTPIPSPQRLQHAGGVVGFEVAGIRGTISVPDDSEVDFRTAGVLEIRSRGRELTIATADHQLRCLEAEQAKAPGGTDVMPRGVVPGIGAGTLTRFTLDGYAGRYFLFTDTSSCRPGEIWDASAGCVGSPGREVRLQLWTLDISGTALIIGACTWLDEPATTLEVIRQMVGSVRIEPTDALGARPLPEGRLAGGWYWATVDGTTDVSRVHDFGPFEILIRTPTGRWSSTRSGADANAWELTTGTRGDPHAASMRIGGVDRVYTDPCAGTLGPPIEASVSALADAMASIPGTVVVERSLVRLRHSTAEHIVLMIPTQLPCSPLDFHLWYDDMGGPRTASVGGSKISLWIFNPNDRDGFGRIVIEAETYAGAYAELERSIWQTVMSISHGG